MATDPALRVLKRIDITEPGCWVWPGSKTPNGYGTVNARPPYVDRQKPLLVHRVMYQHFIGDIPEGLELDHLCRDRLCCNPVHLEPVTRLENIHRGSKYQPDSCIRGHPYPEFMYVRPNGYVCCRECGRIYDSRKARRAHRSRPRP